MVSGTELLFGDEVEWKPLFTLPEGEDVGPLPWLLTAGDIDRDGILDLYATIAQTPVLVSGGADPAV